MEIGVMVDDFDPQRPVRSWMDEHPATTWYIAVVVTILLALQLLELF
jgi:hypothetical protein